MFLIIFQVVQFLNEFFEHLKKIDLFSQIIFDHFIAPLRSVVLCRLHSKRRNGKHVFPTISLQIFLLDLQNVYSIYVLHQKRLLFPSQKISTFCMNNAYTQDFFTFYIFSSSEIYIYPFFIGKRHHAEDELLMPSQPSLKKSPIIQWRHYQHNTLEWWKRTVVYERWWSIKLHTTLGV